MPTVAQLPDLEQQIANMIRRVEALERARPGFGPPEPTPEGGVAWAQAIEETPWSGGYSDGGLTDPDTDDPMGADSGWVDFYWENEADEGRAALAMRLGAGDDDAAYIDNWIEDDNNAFQNRQVYTEWSATSATNSCFVEVQAQALNDGGTGSLIERPSNVGGSSLAESRVIVGRDLNIANGGCALHFGAGHYAQIHARAISGQSQFAPVLDCQSSTGRMFGVFPPGAVFMPNYTTTARDAFSSPDNGTVIWNETLAKLQVRAAGAWVSMH